jgi:hypothetical protein
VHARRDEQIIWYVTVPLLALLMWSGAPAAQLSPIDRLEIVESSF